MMGISGTKSNTKRSRVVREKFAHLPFKTVSEQKEFRDKIRKKVLKQLETARAMEELTSHPDYSFFKKKFEQGMHCRYGRKNDDIVHVYLDDDGIQVEVNENVNTEDKALVGTLVKSLSESLITSYYRAYGYVPSELDPSQEEVDRMILEHLKKQTK